MKLTVVGCAGSFPGPDSPASCYLLEADDEDGRHWRVLIDLGSGALGPLQRLVSLDRLDAVLISHLHPDHFLDLCGLYVARRYAPEQAATGPLPVIGPEGTLSRLAAAYGADSMDGLASVFEVSQWQDGGRITIGPLTVHTRRVQHPVPTYGMRVEHDGRVLAYSADSDSCAALLQLAADADLLLAEASFQEGRDETRGIHLTGQRAGEVARQSGAQRLLLTHIPAWTDPEAVLAEAKAAYPGPVELARPEAQHRI